jgi:hypothetical protein
MKTTQHTIKHDLHLACGNDHLRPRFSYIEFHDGIAYATDAHVAIRVQLTEVFKCEPEAAELLTGYRIHANVWRMLKSKRVEIMDKGVLMLSPSPKHAPSAVLKLDETEFFNGKSLKSSIDAIWPNASDRQALDEIGINTSCLSRASKACRFEYSQAKLTFFARNKTILVQSNDGGKTKSEAVVMPVLLNSCL